MTIGDEGVCLRFRIANGQYDFDLAPLILIKAELRFRNLVYDERMGINALKLISKENERKIKAQQFILETNLPPREEDIDKKHFRPQHCPAVEWRDAYHAS